MIEQFRDDRPGVRQVASKMGVSATRAIVSSSFKDRVDRDGGAGE
jgi:hypothetical protein